MRSTGSGLDTVWTHQPENEVRELPNGALVQVLTVESSYNRKVYTVEVLVGTLPAHKVTLAAFGAIEPFWGRVWGNDDGTWTISVSGSD